MLAGVGRGALLLLLLLVTLFSFALAEKKPAWDYDPDTKMDSAVWEKLFSSDEAFRDGIVYEPKLLLAANEEFEAWLVTYGAEPEEAQGLPSTDGYLVMYVQLAPAPKIIGTLPVGAAPEKTEPACELKFLLDSSRTLDGEHLLKEEIIQAFQIGEAPQAIDALYLDTPALDYLNAGWVNRIRVKDGKPKYTLTYKVRYPVQGEDIESALAAARADGFSLYDPQFPAEIDWGYSKMTLSFSADESVKTKEVPDIGLLGRDDAVRMLAEKMPSEMENWGAAGWGRKNTEALRVAGPIRALRYAGTLEDQSMRIEIWPIPGADGTQYIVEYSMEYETLEETAEFRDGIMERLEEMGILLHEDALKTQMVLGGLELQ